MEHISNQLTTVHQNLEPAKHELKKAANGEQENFSIAIQKEKIVNRPVDDLKRSLLYAFVKIGMRSQNWPTDEEKQVLIQHVLKFYGGHTPEEIMLAFDMAIEGKLNVDVNCYENFSCLYFSNIMAAYREWAKEEYRQLEKPIAQIENKEDMSMEAMQMWFDEVKEKIKSGTILLEFIPPMLYEWMNENGNISKTTAEKNEYIRRAANYRLSKLREELEKEDSATNRYNLSEFVRMMDAGCLEGSEAGKVKTLAKQMCFFETVANT